MNSIIDTIGNTPLVELKNLSPNPSVQIFAKLEGTNPGGSVKDRAALYMIRGALERGIIKPNNILIEATSGNTGIALAMIASIFNISIDLVMPENATRERVLSMKAYGANVILTPASEGMEGAIDFVNDKIRNPQYIKLDQFANPDNPRAHYETTGPEIWQDTQGKITHFVSAMGTTGTIMGTSQYLKEQSQSVQIIGVQPQDGSSIPGIRRWPQEYLPLIYQADRIDEIRSVSSQQAIAISQLLALKEGIFCGMSSGGAVHTAIELSKNLDKGVIVSIICDRGDRYLSSDLFQARQTNNAD